MGVAGVGLGAVAGLAWACGLRSWMEALAGPESTFTWATELGVLVPAAAAGALLGYAASLRLGGRPLSRWLVLSPLVTAAVLVVPGYLVDLLTRGLGSGALLVPMIAMATAYALASGGRPWARALAGALGAAGFVGIAVLPASMQPGLGAGTPQGFFVIVQGLSLIAVFSAAAAIPYGPTRSRLGGSA
ncbi:hypothetical protein CLV56_0104 [Mumia flava]|uniref:Uncharacterized protein n=2 Tax=Mumia flava TaxID=1348852 RepID=A0A2M9BD69_9ACTN|nr:hypothetical protein CLV56_0104 [Mumia flava]